MSFLHYSIFGVFLIAAWLIMNYFGAKSSGWPSLAARYSHYMDLGSVFEKRRFVSINMGNPVIPMRFTISTCIEVCSKGLSIYPIAFFSPFKPQLFIPWEAMHEIKENDKFFYSFDFSVKGAWPRIFVFGSIGKQCADKIRDRAKMNARANQ